MANEVKLKLAVDGASAVVSEVDRVRASMGNLTAAGSLAQSALGGLAAALSVTALVAWGRATLDAADAMNDLSQRVGISVKDMAKYELAAAQSGTTMEALAKGIKGIAGNLQEHGAALKKVGIDATTADGAMQQLADVFAGMPDGMDKTTLAVKLFGKSGMDLIPMLNLGSEGLKTAAEKSAAYAEQMAVMAPLADAFNDSLATLTLQSKVSGLVFLNEMLPSLAYVSAAMADADKSGNTLASTFGQTINTAFEAAVLIASDVIFVFKGMGREIGGIFAQINALGEGGGVFSAKGRAAWTAVGDAMTEDAIKAREDLDRWQDNLVSRSKNTGANYNKHQGFGDTTKDTTAGLALLAALGRTGKTAKEAINEATKGLNLYLELMDKGAGFEKTWAKDANELRAALDAKAISQNQYNAAIDQLLKKQPLMVEAEKLRLELAKENTKAVDDLFEAQEKLRLANEDQIKTTRTLLEQIEFETRLLGLNAEQRAIATMERELEAKGIIKGTQAYDAYIAKLREALSLKVGKEEGIKAADDLSKANQKAAEESAKYWEDALMRAFESGKGFFQSLWGTIKNTLKTQVLKVTVQGVMGSLGIGAAGAAMAGDTGGGNLLGVAGNLSSVYNVATSGIAASVGVVGNAAVASIQGMIGMTGTAAQAATAAANGVAFAATGSGSMLASIGAAAPYALAAVAAVALIKGLFSESREITAQGTQGTFSGAAFAGQNYTTTKVDPGFFSKTYHSTDYSAMDAKTAQAWTDAFAVLKTGAASAATTLGLATDQITAYSKTVDIAVGTTQEQMTALFTGMADEMATATAPGLATFAKVGETASTTLTRLSGSLTLANQWLSNFNETVLAPSLAGGSQASKLVDTFGGADKFASSQSAYYAAMYTDTERLAKTSENVTKGLALVGQAMPASLAEYNAFRDRLVAIDSDYARQTYAVMTALGPEFAQVISGVKDQFAAFDGLTAVMIDTARVQGNTALANQAARMIAVKGMTAEQAAIYDATEARKAYLVVLKQGTTLEAQLAALNPNKAAYRTSEIAKLGTPEEKVQARINYLTQDAIAAYTQQADLLGQLSLLTGEQTDRSIALRDAADDTTRALMRQVFQQQDLKAAAEEATAAWKNQVSTMVSQGQALKDYVAGLGATTPTLASTRSAYGSDLALAKGGDADAIGRITKSADAYMAAAGSVATSAAQQRSLVARIKGDLGGLSPVVKLDENLELLKLIEKSTSVTATATDHLKLNGIQANFDLSQVITFVANSQGIPDDLRKLITDQTKDYQVALKTAFDAGVPANIQNLLTTGAGTYATTVNAALGTADEASRALALTGAGTYATTVTAALGLVDGESRTLALTAAGNFLTTVNAALGITDPTARDMAYRTVNQLTAYINTAQGWSDETARDLAYRTVNSLTSYINTAQGWADPVARDLAYRTVSELTAYVNTAQGRSDPTARDMAYRTVNELTSYVHTVQGWADPVARDMAYRTVNEITTAVNTAQGWADPVAMALAFNTANTISATITAALGATDASALALGLKSANTIATLVTTAQGWTDATAQALAFKSANDLATTVTAALGTTDSTARTLALTNANNLLTTVSANLSADGATQALTKILQGTQTGSVAVSGAVIFDPSNPMQSVFDAISKSTADSKAALNATLKNDSTAKTATETWQEGSLKAGQDAASYLSQLVSLTSAKSLADAQAAASAKAAADKAIALASAQAKGQGLATSKSSAIDAFNSTYSDVLNTAANLGVSVRNASGGAASATYDSNGSPYGNIASFVGGNRSALIDYLDANGSARRNILDGTGATVSSLSASIEAQRQVIRDLGGVPAFAKGTNFLPNDMFAKVHQGERIVPAADNRELMHRLQSPQKNDDALIAEIRALRQEVEGLRAEARATASNTGKTAKLISRAMPDGDALATRTAA